MTKTDFAELKELLEGFDAGKARLASHKQLRGIHQDRSFINGGRYENAKSAAIISELIDIIQSQSEALESCGCLCGSFDFDNSACTPCSTLSETTTRLQKLREGK